MPSSFSAGDQRVGRAAALELELAAEAGGARRQLVEAGDRAGSARLRRAGVGRVALQVGGDLGAAERAGDRALVARRGRPLELWRPAVDAVDVAVERARAVGVRVLLEAQLAAERALRVREVHELARLLHVEGGTGRRRLGRGGGGQRLARGGRGRRAEAGVRRLEVVAARDRRLSLLVLARPTTTIAATMATATARNT